VREEKSNTHPKGGDEKATVGLPLGEKKKETKTSLCSPLNTNGTSNVSKKRKKSSPGLVNGPQKQV
jgi:hypothetical protein